MPYRHRTLEMAAALIFQWVKLQQRQKRVTVATVSIVPWINFYFFPVQRSLCHQTPGHLINP
uniref:Uncharacterized protein n=1 Tax=Rhizophora mucronata TaxID=61149 RepID=A0A2P2Q861_RHIMU